MVCKHLSGSLRSRKLYSYSSSFGELSRYACARPSWTRNKKQESSSTGASVDMDLQQTANSSRHLFELWAGGEGHEAVAEGDSCRRATANSVSSALSSTYDDDHNNSNRRARALARSLACRPHCREVLSSGVGRRVFDGTNNLRFRELGYPATPKERTPGCPSLRDPTFRIKDPPVPSIAITISKAKETPSSGYFKKSQTSVRFHERTGSFLGS
jgi:hypothetical protein